MLQKGLSGLLLTPSNVTHVSSLYNALYTGLPEQRRDVMQKIAPLIL
jgi:hypothetical protein